MGERKLRIKDGNMVEYEIYDLVPSTDPILKQKCEPFDFSNPQVPANLLSLSLAETMGAKGGIGLAAPQVNIPLRVISVALIEGNTDSKTWDVITLFNPEIVLRSDLVVKQMEGCLSFPGMGIEVERHDEIEVEYQNLRGEKIRGRFFGIDARCIQHEIDHLNGKCFTDGLSPLKIKMMKQKSDKRIRKIEKLQKNQLKNILSQLKQ